MTIDTIIFYNQWHIGDLLLSEGLVRQFCRNNPSFKYYYALCYGAYIFKDLPEINCINLDETPAFKNSSQLPYFLLNDHTLAINTWVMGILSGDWSKQNEYECIIHRIYEQMRANVIYMNIQYGINITLPSCNKDELLPILPKVDIERFLTWKRDKTQKLIMYYNYNPMSGQSIGNINHDVTIFNLAMHNTDKLFIVAKLSEQLKSANLKNIIDSSEFGYNETPTCENIGLLHYIEQHCDYGIHYDIGACFFYIPVDFVKSKCIIIHGANTAKFYNALKENSSLSNEEYKKKYRFISTASQERYLNAVHELIK